MSAPHSTDRPSLVYFIRCGRKGPIKIGRTFGDPKRRLRVLQQANPFRLHMLATILETEQLNERVLHGRFAHLRIRGEWFRSAPELLEFVAELPAALPFSGPHRRRYPHRETRLRHIEFARQVLETRAPMEQIASLYGISRRTAFNWFGLALAYPDPEADEIREMDPLPRGRPSRRS